MRTVKVGLVGLGTVGGGVVDIFGKHADDFRRHAGVDMQIARYCDRDTTRVAALGIPADAFTGDYAEIVNDPEIDQLVKEGVIKGGMVPKAESACEALLEGVKSVHIINGRKPATLLAEVFTDTGAGTMIHREGTT